MKLPKKFEGELKEGMEVNVYRREDTFWEKHFTGIIVSGIIGSYAIVKDKEGALRILLKEGNSYESLEVGPPTLVEVIPFKVKSWKELISPPSPTSQEVASSD